MALIFPQTTDGETITIPAGTHSGSVLLTQHRVTFQGAGVDESTVVADGTYASVFQPPYPPQTDDGQPIDVTTIRDITIDCDFDATISAALQSGIFAGPLQLVLERVRIRNATSATIAVLVGARAVLRDVEIWINGRAIVVSTSSTGMFAECLSVEGGGGAVTVAVGTTGTVPGIVVRNATLNLDYWASPVYETCTPTSYAAQRVDVVSHVSAARSANDVLRALTPARSYVVGARTLSAGLQVWDRVETAAGRWAQVTDVDGTYATIGTWHDAGSWNPCDEPTGSAATIFRVALGRLSSGGWTSTRLSINAAGEAPDAHWRKVAGGTQTLPTVIAGSRLDILRHGLSDGQTRDVDTGAIHITQTARNARLHEVHVRGGFSDMITVRGPDGHASRCSVQLGQDMGYTVDGTFGTQTLVQCEAEAAGYSGFFLFADAPAAGLTHLRMCHVHDNGLHDDGSLGPYGVHVYDDNVAASVLQVYGDGNVGGLMGGERTEPDALQSWLSVAINRC